MITYQTKNTHPGTLPSATIYMGGLLCLSFDRANKCTVGVNSSVGNGHTWKCSIVDQQPGEPLGVRKASDKPIVVCEQADALSPREIHIDVTGGTTGGAYVYNGNRAVLIPDINEQRFNLESSWVDLEGPRGHNRKVENDADTLWPRFYINDALFCASKLSTESFTLRDSNSTPLTKPLGNVALEIVADIFLDTSNQDSKIEIKLPDNTITLDNTKRYKIYITNDCDYASVAPVQTDFYLHYKAFSGAFGGSRGKMKTNDRFQLVCDNSSAKGKTESILAQTGDDYPESATDRAPCMTVVLGQTSAFKQ